MNKKIILSLLLSLNLYSVDFCTKGLLESNYGKISREGVLNDRFIPNEDKKNFNTISSKLLYNEPFNNDLVNSFISIIEKSKMKVTPRLLSVIENINILNPIYNEKIQNFYISHFEEIKKIYLDRPRYSNYLILRDLNILSDEELLIFKNKLPEVKNEYFSYIEDIKHGKLPKIKNKDIIDCRSHAGVLLYRSKQTVLRSIKQYINYKNGDISYEQLMASIDSIEIYDLFEFLYTGNHINLYMLNKNNNELYFVVKEEFNKGDLYASWWYAKTYLSKIHNNVTYSEVKKINEIKNILIMSGEDISSFFKEKGDFKTYKYIKNKTILLSSKIYD